MDDLHACANRLVELHQMRRAAEKKFLVRLREELERVSANSLAAELGFTAQYVSDIKRGKRPVTEKFSASVARVMAAGKYGA